jgi:RNA polymerase sigma factor (sigma-70 family)
MATAQPLLHYLRRLTAGECGAGLPDADLLDRYARLGDDQAFAALVRRHGPLVFAACRRVLGNVHDAEDCFQATFLVLARTAHSPALPRALGPWLYGVAWRTALKARTRAARRQRQEAKAARSTAIRNSDEGMWCDLRPVLDEAVGRLPEKYRTPFVLCCLQGVTVTEAAGQLGCPRGTVAARLARAKERLRHRLARQGITLGAALGAALAMSQAAPAEFPPGLVLSTVQAAGLSAASRAAAARGVPVYAALKGMVQAVFANKIRSVAALLLLLAAVAGAVRGRPDPAPPEPPVPPAAEAHRADRAAVPQLGGKARFLSLDEAVAIALEHHAANLRGGAGAEGERNTVLLNVEAAYWNLYGIYWCLHSREQALRLAHQTWKEADDSYRAGRAGFADIAHARGQYELFRSQRLQSMDTVLEYERQLRTRLGMPPSGGPRLVPSDAPSLVVDQPDWAASLREALANSPELRLTRQELDQGKPRPARSDQARSDQVLRDQELKVERFLALQYRQLGLTYQQVKACRAQREAFATQLKTCHQQYLAGRGTLDLLLEAQRFWANALAQEYAAIVAHNNAQCRFAFAKGSMRQRATKEDGGATTAPTLVTLWKSVVPLEDVQSLPLLETPAVQSPPLDTPRGAKDSPLTPWKEEDLFPRGVADRQQDQVPRRLP